MIHPSFNPNFVTALSDVRAEHCILVLSALDVLPSAFSNVSLARAISEKWKTGKYFSFRIDAYNADIGSLHILCVPTKAEIGPKIAEYVRGLTGDIALSIGSDIDPVVRGPRRRRFLR